ncbi:MAG: glycoside hydrolase family 31 protein [Polyangiales bacterium]
MRTRYLFSDGSDERSGRWFFPQGYHAAYRLALDRYAGGDGFTLGRQSSWGGQRVLDIVWPGDLDNDFRPQEGNDVGGLPAAISGMISLAESGFPSFASDTGGYRGGMPTREALLRWAEHTALSPFMQLGGGGRSHNPWEYDTEAVTTYRGLARLHQDLAPYYIANARRASTDGTPPVRSVALAFPDDPAARTDRYAYVLGDDLLVAPVVTAGASQRMVHLPAGEWVHWWTGVRTTGPMDVTVPTPIGQPAFFVRVGAVIPLAPQEIATMAPATDADVIDLGDRATVARAVVATREGEVEGASGDTTVSVTRAGNVWRVRWNPAPGVETLRLEMLHEGLMFLPTAPGLTANEGAGSGACDDCITSDARRIRMTLRAQRDVSVTVAP